MAIYLYAIAVQKVQSFLFDALQSHEQEKQTDEDTLKSVFNKSLIISQDLRHAVKEQFEGDMLTVEVNSKKCKWIPCGSGMVLFAANVDGDDDNYKNETHNKLKDFFEEQYLIYKAAMRISYTMISLEKDENKNYYTQIDEKTIRLEEDALEKINSIKDELKSISTNNQIIQDHSDLLFNFNPNKDIDCANEKAENRHKDDDKIKPWLDDAIPGCLVNQFSELRPKSKSQHSQKDDPNRYYIAFLKADLDGMGNAFKNVATLSGYAKMSDLLNKWVSFDGIAQAIHETGCATENSQKFLPIYAAGDDIFCAVCVSNIPRAVSVYKYILDKINEELRDAKNDGANAVKLKGGKIAQLSMRIGIDITWANQPIRYYWQRTESQMEKCRGEVPELLKDSGYAKIAIGDAVFWDYRKDDIINSDYRENQKFAREYAEKKKDIQVNYLLKELPSNLKCFINKHDERQNLTDNEKKLYKTYISEKRKKLNEKNYKNELAQLRDTQLKNGGKTYKYYIDQVKIKDVNELGNYPTWHDFISDIGYINYSCDGSLHPSSKADDKRVITTSHLFNLLNALESNDTNPKYIANVLYRLMPEKIRGIEGVKRDIEITEETANVLTDEAAIWHIITKKLIKKKRVGIRTESEVIDISKNSNDISFVIAYIKLLLLFCDPRFNINVGSLSEDTIDFKLNDTVDDLNHFYTMFLDYLLKVGSISEYKSLFKMFADKTKDKLKFYTEDSKKKNGKPYRESYNDFITLSIVEKSMLFRFKNLLQTLKQEVAVEKIAKMIENKKGNISPTDNPLSNPHEAEKEEVREYNSWLRRQLNEKYSTNNFLSSKEYFDKDFVDLLIVFYSYISVRAAYKAIKLNKYTK